MRTTLFLLASGLLASVAVAAPLTTMPNATAAKLPAESELPNTEDVDDTATKETAKTTSVSPDLLRQAPGEARHKRNARDVRARTDIDTIMAMIEDLTGGDAASLDAILALLEGLAVTGTKRENKEPAHGAVPRDTITETVNGVTDPVTGAVDDLVESVTKRGSSSKNPSSSMEGASKSGVIKRENKEPAHGVVPRQIIGGVTSTLNNPITGAIGTVILDIPKRDSSSSSSKGPSSLLEGVSKSGVIDDSFAGAVGVTNSVGGIATVLGTTVVNKRDGENVPREAAPLVIGALCKRDGENARREAATVDIDASTCA
ncbi:uncharacterized protein CTRU02_200162 [Colletotrichum truncatum]|uniref:Uncharacterized protein n=1 Tax=Colletotrichum truncatum TaxID=5467 RepID=A0ACC3ZDU5_COLTU|nr:uncharacterized protein CTRU02_05038 [Colletotrichum truncatum]KAF6794837.1 hypothetical protein CTRU02_05038 [Colletotrichum truncatum]